MPASMSAASCGVSGLRRSTPETSPKKCGCSWRMVMAMARLLLIEASGYSALLGKKLLPDPMMSTSPCACPPSGVAGHQAAVHRDDGAGQERGRRQAQAQRDMGDLLGVAVAAERGAALGVDRLVLLRNPLRDCGPDRARADAVHGDAFATEFHGERACQAG